MPRAYGGDLVERAPDGSWLLTATVSKGWTARSPATRTSVEHPGSAVVWEDERYEVVDAEVVPGAGVRYHLAPWDDAHVIRVQSHYNASEESRRRQEVKDLESRRVVRLLLIVGSPFTGLLPVEVQERLEREYGAPATSLTLVSTVIPFVFGFFCLFALLLAAVGVVMGGGIGDLLSVAPILFFGVFLLIESCFRFAIGMSEERPIGSILGTLPWAVYEAIRGRKGSGLSKARGTDDELTAHALMDAYVMKEPFLGLLSAAEQRVLHERFAFDPLKWGRRTAISVLLFMCAQAVFSIRLLGLGAGGTVFLPLLLALGLIVEQVTRLAALSKGEPSGSILAFLVRPFAARLLR
jgi:hypothetical protein